MSAEIAEVTITTIFRRVLLRFKEWAKTKAPSEYSSFVANVTHASPSIMDLMAYGFDELYVVAELM